jgi:Zn-dependent peptidase ImmA (M78 family)/transcriptional regulator with XRE-family HTH domain
MTRELKVTSSLRSSAVSAVTESAEIGRRIKSARTAAGLSGEALGSRIGLKRDQISKIESGKRKADAGELLLISEVLGTNIDTFLGRGKRKRLQIAHRLSPGTQSADVIAVWNRARQLVEIEDLLERMSDSGVSKPSEEGLLAQAEIKQISQVLISTQAEAKRQGQTGAEIVRKVLDLGSDGLSNLPELFERHFGVHVSLGPWGEQVDGLCVHSDDFALLMASTDFSQGHTNFTLAHELAHHLFQDPREIITENSNDMFSDDVLEKRANAFAAYFLMPIDGLRAILSYQGEKPGGLSGRSAIRLMETFGVSMKALTYHLSTIEWMNSESGRNLRELGVGNLVAKYSGDAPNGAWATPSRNRRYPARLVSAATDAVRGERLGLGPLATLLEREDNDELWDEITSELHAG